MTKREWLFQVIEVVRVVDGDTYWLRVDVGFRQWTLIEVRLLGWDTPELRSGTSMERAAGLEAKAEAETFIEQAVATEDLWVRTEEDADVYGRWLGTLFRESDQVELGKVLEADGLATEWPTRWHEEHPG